MVAKDFLLGKHRIVLAVLLIVFVSGIIVFSNGQPTGFQTTSAPTGFQTASQQLPANAVISKVGFVSEKYPGTNYASVRTIDLGDTVGISSIDFEATLGGEHCRSGIMLSGEVPRTADKDKIIPIPILVRPSDYYYQNPLLTSYELAAHEKFSATVEGSGYVQRFSVEATHVESNDDTKKAEEFVTKGGFKVLKVFVRTLSRIIPEGAPVTERLLDCKFIDSFKADIVFSPTPKSVSFDKSSPVIDSIVITKGSDSKPLNKEFYDYTSKQFVYLIDPSKVYEIVVDANDDQSGLGIISVKSTPHNANFVAISGPNCAALFSCIMRFSEAESEMGKLKYFHIEAVNGAGLKRSMDIPYIVTGKDGQLSSYPTLTVSHSPENPTVNDAVRLTASVSWGREIDIDTIKINLDNDLARECNGLLSCAYTIISPSPGSHKYYATAESSDGKYFMIDPNNGFNYFTVSSQSNQISLPKGRTSTDDTISPQVTATLSPANPKTGDSITITATASDEPGGSGLKSANIWVDNSAVKHCTSSPCTYTTSFSTSGSHSYFANAIDNSGNIGDWPAEGSSASFTVSAPQTQNAPRVQDTVAPKISISKSPQDPKEGDKVTITATATDNLQAYEITLWADGTSKTCRNNCLVSKKCPVNTFTCSTEITATKGTHTYLATAIDSAGGNTAKDPSDKPQYTFTIAGDAQLPTVALSYSPQNPGFGDQIQATATSTDNAGVKSIDIYVVGVDNAKKANGYIDTCTFTPPKTSASCTKIVYKKSGYNQLLFRATATDTSGNAYTSDSKTIVLRDTIAPIVTASHSPSSPKSGDKVTITASATDETSLKSLELYVNNEKVSATCKTPSTSGSTGVGGRSFGNSFTITGGLISAFISSIATAGSGGNSVGSIGTQSSASSSAGRALDCTYTTTYSGTPSIIIYHAQAIDAAGNTAKTKATLVS